MKLEEGWIPSIRWIICMKCTLHSALYIHTTTTPGEGHAGFTLLTLSWYGGDVIAKR